MNLTDLNQALDVLKRGGVILYPTDTVWGIGCDATRADAVKRIFDIKRRADGKALICLLGSADDLSRYVDGIPEVAYELIEAAVEPLTVVYDRALVPPIASNLPAADGSVAVRVTRHPFCAELCRRLRRPLVSTSANISGTPSPATYAAISQDIKDAVDYVCISERSIDTPRKPSTIIKLSGSGVINILRP